VKRVPDDHELEVSVRLHFFGAAGGPGNVAYSASTSVGARELDGLGLLIDGAHLGESRRETERELTRSAREVEQPSSPGRVGAPAQIIEQRRRVRHPELVVEPGRPAIEVGTELGLVSHSPIFAPWGSLCGVTQQVGTVESIRRYPVKSMLGEVVDSASVSRRGLDGDRAYALIDENTGKVVSVKYPKRWGRMFELAAVADEWVRELKGGVDPYFELPSHVEDGGRSSSTADSSCTRRGTSSTSGPSTS
jgi:MOSC N-terminal beta barrel domain